MTLPARDHRRTRVANLTTSLHTFLGVVALVVLVFLMISLSAQRSSSAESSSAAVTLHDAKGSLVPTLKYTVVTGGTQSDNVIRYAAYELIPDDKTNNPDQPSSERQQQRKPVSVRRWAELFAPETEWAFQLRNDFSDTLKDCPYKAIFFETKGASSVSALEKQFEFVLIDAPNLYSFADGQPDPDTFAQHLHCSPNDLPGCAFASLGGDAMLVAPRRDPNVPLDAYAHLAAFVRGASPAQVNRYWKMVANEYLKALSNGTVWLSTDGTGVAWLHMRLDSRPKYYKYNEFAKET